MGRSRRTRFLYCAVLLALGACGPDEDVQLLALPPEERPSPEARLGLPELAGDWNFGGWEVVEGDSTALERTFPGLGQLRFTTQRLDSIAGAVVLNGTPVPVVGDVRRDGRLTFVTLGSDGPRNFAAGVYQRDTLWLELSSLLPADEWPRNARAAFVRETPSVPPFAWLRGARIPEVLPAPPVDSLAPDSAEVPGGSGGDFSTPSPSGGATPPAEATPGQGRPAQPPTPSPALPSGQAAAQPQPQPQAQPQPQPQPGGQPSPNPTPPAAPQPPTPGPGNQPVEPSPAPAQQPQAPSPEAPPAPAPSQPPAEGPGPLLGEPIDP